MSGVPPVDAVFDVAAFMKVKAGPRTQALRVPALAAFFPEGADPVWTVRGLEGAEWAVVLEAEARARARHGIAGALSPDGDAVAAIRAAAGIPDPSAVPTFVQGVEYLVLGSVAPKCTHALAVKLSQLQPFVFFELVKTIKLLTGVGVDLGKSMPSGETAASV
ncbi:hypothetical protein [Thauera aromatica]|uniref:hypothetical protein n=1 Tax=Thauera aromatica TaxID=59405 RepID=UPI001FFD268E|nr:hypothetical protein [Thauera aromatica]MCK2095627.1 hypothetical protein [Thauera aromatica]